MGHPKGGALKGVGPKISRFFFPPPATVSLFLCLFGCLLVEFWWCLKRRGPEMCTFGVLGLSCASPGLQKHHQNSTQGPQERERRTKIVVGGGKKKARNFGRSGGRLSGRGWFTRGRGPSEGSIRVQGLGFRVQFRFLGTKTENRNRTNIQNEEREMSKNKEKVMKQ